MTPAADLAPAAAAPFRALVQQLDPAATFRRAWPLTGGVSATVTVVEFARADAPDHPARVVVRQHGEADRRQNPDVARTEFTLLGRLQAHGVPVPPPLLLDDSGTRFPVPVIVVGFVVGETDVAPGAAAASFDQAAAALARIHELRADPAGAGLPRSDGQPGPAPAHLDESLQEGRIRAALANVDPAAAANPAVLLHGDYWPGNWLWRDGRLAAILDWEDAAVGDPLADLGNCRLELLWAFGADAMTDLTRHYLDHAVVDSRNLPYWDLVAALRPCGKLATWGLDPATERRMRERHQWFVDQALARLAAP